MFILQKTNWSRNMIIWLRSWYHFVNFGFGVAFQCITGLKDANQIQVQMHPLNLYTIRTHSYLKKHKHTWNMSVVLSCAYSTTTVCALDSVYDTLCWFLLLMACRNTTCTPEPSSRACRFIIFTSVKSAYSSFIIFRHAAVTDDNEMWGWSHSG